MAKHLESLEDILIHTLLAMEIINPEFQGSVTLHISKGGLCDVDRLEKSLKRSGKWCNRLSGLSNAVRLNAGQ